MRRRQPLTGWLLLAPSLLLLGGLVVFPILYNVWLSLFNKHAFLPVQQFVGLGHYRYFATDPEFWASFRHGVVYAGATMVVAQSVVAMRETQQVILSTFAWGTVISIVLALAGGYAQSKGPVQRLREIAQTTRAIVEGRFDRRIATTGSRDDLDRLSFDINRMLDRIQDLMQSLKQVSSDIAHDLRTPISRLRQELDTLQRNPGTVAETQAAIHSALRELDTIIDTFDALLRIAQIEGGARRANFARDPHTRQ